MVKSIRREIWQDMFFCFDGEGQASRRGNVGQDVE